MTDIRHWRTIRRGVVIVETPIFTRGVLDRLSDDEYRRLQVILANRPTVGSLMLMIYSKRERDDLRPGQLKALRKTVVEEF
ncbi:MAG: hypothetical protein ACREJ4_08225 [Candidatus Methylomirabilaceae bacterium]